MAQDEDLKLLRAAVASPTASSLASARTMRDRRKSIAGS